MPGCILQITLLSNTRRQAPLPVNQEHPCCDRSANTRNKEKVNEIKMIDKTRAKRKNGRSGQLRVFSSITSLSPLRTIWDIEHDQH